MELAKLREIRKIAIIAMFSDDDLMQILVLKGGNAISLLIAEYSRASIDLDFSLSDDIDDDNLPIIRDKIHSVLNRTFNEYGFIVLDFKFYPKPKKRKDDLEGFWGGYRVEFKAIDKEKFDSLGGKIEQIRKQSLALGSGDKRVFTMDISRHEYCDTKMDIELDGYTIYVYTPVMMAVEKLRAICQQMPEYKYGKKSGRARDFYDIHLLSEHYGIDFGTEESMELTRLIFRAKDVPLELIGKIPEQRAFHEGDFTSVESSTASGVELQSYDYYFDYVVDKTNGLKSLWEE